ncbi:hypothetical protein NKDENANG_00406 [Candidatus Entotheonellaceae bacterium PAL068K]
MRRANIRSVAAGFILAVQGVPVNTSFIGTLDLSSLDAKRFQEDRKIKARYGIAWVHAVPRRWTKERRNLDRTLMAMGQPSLRVRRYGTVHMALYRRISIA